MVCFAIGIIEKLYAHRLWPPHNYVRRCNFRMQWQPKMIADPTTRSRISTYLYANF